MPTDPVTGSYSDLRQHGLPTTGLSSTLTTLNKQKKNTEELHREKCTPPHFTQKTVSNLLHSSVRNKFGEHCPLGSPRYRTRTRTLACSFGHGRIQTLI